MSHNFATPNIPLLFMFIVTVFALLFLSRGILLAPSSLLDWKPMETETVGEPARVVSIERESRYGLPEYSWEEVSEPGTYLEKEREISTASQNATD